MKLTFDVPEEMAEKIARDIKAALEEHKKKQIWPQKDDPYYYIDTKGSVDIEFYVDDVYDNGRLNLGNCFKTQEEAKFKLEQLKVMHELEQLADNDGEWNVHLPHYYIQYDYEDGWMVTDYTYRLKANMFYFQTREAAQAAIDKIGADRLKKYYFCIPEE